MAPLYEIEWRKPLPPVKDPATGERVAQDDRVIRTRSSGSTPGKAIANMLTGPGGVMPYEVEGYPTPTVHEVDEDGQLTPVVLSAEDRQQAGQGVG